MSKASKIKDGIKDQLIKPDPENAEMSYALQLVSSTHSCLFLTGKAGTGKSTLLRYISNTTKKKHIVLAPTGLAALNVNGQTIHSFFHLPLVPLLPDDTEQVKAIVSRISNTDKDLIRSLEMIIIDEVSMLRIDIIDAMDNILRRICKNKLMPFGGIQMLFVGDLYQLEPVAMPTEKDILARYYRSLFFFDARAFATIDLVRIELTKVYRQGDINFISMLDRIRVGAHNNNDVRQLDSRVNPNYEPGDEDFVVTICNTRRRVNEINDNRLQKVDSELHTFIGEIEGTFPESSLPTEKELKLKEGAQIIFVQNDPDKRWVNGTVGVIKEISPGSSSIEVLKDDGEKVRVERSGWENVKYSFNEKEKKIEREVIGSYRQYPIKLAWAITIHKSQGLSFDKVIVDLTGGSFAAGQTYVALSRCRTLEGMILRVKFNPFGVIVRNEVKEFYKGANNLTQINLVLAQAEAEKDFVRAARLFDADKYVEATKLFAHALKDVNIFNDELANRMLRYKLMKIDGMHHMIQHLRDRLRKQDEMHKELADEFIDMGNMCVKMREFEAAVKNYKKALKLQPHNARIKHYLADALKGITKANKTDKGKTK